MKKPKKKMADKEAAALMDRIIADEEDIVKSWEKHADDMNELLAELGLTKEDVKKATEKRDLRRLVWKVESIYKKGNAKDKKALAMLIGLYYDAVIGWPEELERRKKEGSPSGAAR